ncbi:MAG: recombinase RecA, partial [Mobilitalea sp.]
KGISREGDVLDLAAEINIVNKSGSWYAYNNEKIGQGRENTKAYFVEHPEIMKEVELKVREYYHLNVLSEVKKIQTIAFDGPKSNEKRENDTGNDTESDTDNVNGNDSENDTENNPEI